MIQGDNAFVLARENSVYLLSGESSHMAAQRR